MESITGMSTFPFRKSSFATELTSYMYAHESRTQQCVAGRIKLAITFLLI